MHTQTKQTQPSISPQPRPQAGYAGISFLRLLKFRAAQNAADLKIEIKQDNSTLILDLPEKDGVFTTAARSFIARIEDDLAKLSMDYRQLHGWSNPPQITFKSLGSHRACGPYHLQITADLTSPVFDSYLKQAVGEQIIPARSFMGARALQDLLSVFMLEGAVNYTPGSEEPLAPVIFSSRDSNFSWPSILISRHNKKLVLKKLAVLRCNLNHFDHFQSEWSDIFPKFKFKTTLHRYDKDSSPSADNLWLGEIQAEFTRGYISLKEITRLTSMVDQRQQNMQKVFKKKPVNLRPFIELARSYGCQVADPQTILSHIAARNPGFAGVQADQSKSLSILAGDRSAALKLRARLLSDIDAVNELGSYVYEGMSSWFSRHFIDVDVRAKKMSLGSYNVCLSLKHGTPDPELFRFWIESAATGQMPEISKLAQKFINARLFEDQAANSIRSV